MDYDIIITGGGAAGLSFISHLLQSDWKDKRVLLLEEAAKTRNDRTWCYWAEAPLPYAGHRYSWKALSICDPSSEQRVPLHRYRYFEINSLAFYEEQYARIAHANHIDLRYERVSSIRAVDGGAEVHSHKGRYTASWVINSIPKLLQELPQKFGLTQNFKGWRIRSKKAVFDPGRLVLMDFFDSSADFVSFYYVLPYSKHYALVEYTRLSKELPPAKHYQDCLENYLQERYGLKEKDYAIEETEEGVIPMSDFQFERQPQPRVLQLGTAGGSTKATTGYTFHNIQTEAQELLAYMQNRAPRPKPSKRFRFYDQLLLSIMREHPAQVPKIMKKLFRAKSADPILRFLDEEAAFGQEFPLFWRLPWGPFLRALVQKRRPAYVFAAQTTNRRPIPSPLPRH